MYSYLSAFHLQNNSVNRHKYFGNICCNLNLLQLSEIFDWLQLTKPYLNRVKATISESDKLREIFDSAKIKETIREITKEIANITQTIPGNVTDSDLHPALKTTTQKYYHLEFDSLYTSVSTNKQLRSPSTFITQPIRYCAQISFNALENTKKYQKWLRETNQTKVEVNPKDLECYSLDLFTVELYRWKLKHFLHSKATCTYEALDQAMTVHHKR